MPKTSDVVPAPFLGADMSVIRPPVSSTLVVGYWKLPIKRGLLMEKKTAGNVVIALGAIGSAVSLFVGNQPGLFFMGLVVLGIGLFLRLKK